MIGKLVDHRNRDLWNLIDANFDVKIKYTRKPWASVYCKGSSVIFRLPKKDLSPDSFTHELLHVYLKHKEVNIGAAIQNMVIGNQNLKRLFNPDLFSHIGNCLDHVKILPIYLQLGFDRANFISDYNDNGFTLTRFQSMELFFKANSLSSSAFPEYVGAIIGMFAEPNVSFDHSALKLRYRNLDEALYMCVETLFKSWDQVNINSTDVMETSYHEVANEFIFNIEDWIDSLENTT